MFTSAICAPNKSFTRQEGSFLRTVMCYFSLHYIALKHFERKCFDIYYSFIIGRSPEPESTDRQTKHNAL